MKKLYQSVLALSLLAFPLTNVVSAADTPPSTVQQITVTIDGKTLSFDQAPVLTNHGRTLVEMRTILESLGAKVSWDSSTQTATAIRGTTIIQIPIGSYFAQKNGFSVSLDEKAQLINGRTMVPIRFVSEALGDAVRWHPESNTVAIYTNVSSDQNNSTTSTSQSNSSTNTTTNSVNSSSLSYQDAVTMAQNSSYTLKNALQNIDISKDSLSQAADNVKFTPASGGNATVNNAFTNYTKAQLGVQINKKTAEITEDTIAYAVKQAYNSVLAALQNQQLNDLALKNAQIQDQLAHVQYQNGTASSLDVTKADAALTSAQQTDASGQTAISNGYQAFNLLVGLPVDAKPQLIDVPQMKKLDNTVSVDNRVSQVLSESPDIWTAEQQVNLAQLQVDLYTFNNPQATQTYAGTQMGVDVANNTLASLKQQLEQKIRTLYYSIQQNEEQYDALKAAINLDEQNLKAVQAKYDAGTAIQADLVSAQYTLEKDKNALFNLTIQHDNSMMAYDKPWVSGGSGSSGGSSSKGS